MNEQASIFAPARDAGQAEPPRETDLIRLGAIVAAIGRGWWIVFIATAACLALAYHYAFNVATPTYRAAASIVLETGERAFISFDESTGQLSRDTPSLNTQIGVLRGIDLMGRVVDVMALDRDPEFNPIPAVPAGGQSDAREAQLAREIALRNLLGAGRGAEPAGKPDLRDFRDHVRSGEVDDHREHDRRDLHRRAGRQENRRKPGVRRTGCATACRNCRPSFWRCRPGSMIFALVPTGDHGHHRPPRATGERGGGHSHASPLPPDAPAGDHRAGGSAPAPIAASCPRPCCRFIPPLRGRDTHPRGRPGRSGCFSGWSVCSCARPRARASGRSGCSRG